MIVTTLFIINQICQCFIQLIMNSQTEETIDLNKTEETIDLNKYLSVVSYLTFKSCQIVKESI